MRKDIPKGRLRAQQFALQEVWRMNIDERPMETLGLQEGLNNEC